MSIIGTFLEVVGERTIGLTPGFLLRKWYPDARLGGLIEIDVRSSNGVVLTRGSAQPTLHVYLRITNHAPFEIFFDSFSVGVWFGQPTIKLSPDHPFSVKAHATANDIYVFNMLNESQKKQAEACCESDGFGQSISLNITAVCRCSFLTITKSVLIERREKELKSVIW